MFIVVSPLRVVNLCRTVYPLLGARGAGCGVGVQVIRRERERAANENVTQKWIWKPPVAPVNYKSKR